MQWSTLNNLLQISVESQLQIIGQKLDKEKYNGCGRDMSAARPCANVKNSKLLSSDDSFLDAGLQYETLGWQIVKLKYKAPIKSFGGWNSAFYQKAFYWK